MNSFVWVPQVAGGLGLIEANRGVECSTYQAGGETTLRAGGTRPVDGAGDASWDPAGLAFMTPRTPENDAELRYWLENMMVDHRYSVDEASLTTGLDKDQVQAAMARFGIDGNQPARHQGSKLQTGPLPGRRPSSPALAALKERLTRNERQRSVSLPPGTRRAMWWPICPRRSGRTSD